MTLREIFTAGFWVVSVVEVGGFTYEAFSNTYQQFAIPSGGGAFAGGSIAQTPEAKQAASNASSHDFGPFSPIVNALQTAANAPLKLLGLTPLEIDPGTAGMTSKQLAHLNSLKQPPQTMVNQIKRANTSGNKQQLLSAANGFLGWARQNGWTDADVKLALQAFGIKVFN